jgi:hypothetical protein
MRPAFASSPTGAVAVRDVRGRRKCREQGRADFGMLPSSNNEAGETGRARADRKGGLEILREPCASQQLRPRLPLHDLGREPRAGDRRVVDGCPPGSRCPRPTSSPGSTSAGPGPVALHHPAQEPTRCEDPLRRVRGAHHRHADQPDDRQCRPALEGLFRDRQAYRPGHADYAYDAKYGLRDYRGGGRSSARETAARVAAGAVARLVIPEVTIRAGRADRRRRDRPRRFDWDEIGRQSLLLPRPPAARWEGYLDEARKAALARRGRRMRRRPACRRLGRAGLRQARRRARRRR